jgi:glycerophosphoryl diester phosphodiesterase
MTTKTIHVLSLALMMVSCGIADFTFDATAGSRHVMVHGHRGARARFPENTLPAFDYAMKAGADFLELDLQVTKDRKLVIDHDAFINLEHCLGPGGTKLSTGPLIFSLTLDEVKKYDCGSLPNLKFPEQKLVPGTRLSTLDELFTMVENSKDSHAKTVQFNIETKIRPDKPNETTTPEEFTKLILDTLTRHKMIERSILQSFDYRTLAVARRLQPRLRLSALIEDHGQDMLQVARETHVQIISPDFRLLGLSIVEGLHKMGVQVHPWTPDNELEWDMLLRMGVDGIITDDPEALIKFLAQRK